MISQEEIEKIRIWLIEGNNRPINLDMNKTCPLYIEPTPNGQARLNEVGIVIGQLAEDKKNLQKRLENV